MAGVVDNTKLILVNNKIGLHNVKACNPVKQYTLPANTLRLRFDDISVDPSTWINLYRTDLVWTNIGSGIWELKCESNDWSNLLNDFMYNEDHMLHPEDTVKFSIIDAGDTSSVTNMTNAFRRCTGLQTICLFNTANVTSMESMFAGALCIKTVPLFNTSKVTTMDGMFNAVTEADHKTDANILEYIPEFDTHLVTKMDGTFNKCVKLKTIPLLNTSNVTSMRSIFYGCSSLKTIPLLDTSNVTDMYYMFSGCTSLKAIPLIDTSKVIDMQGMFADCCSLRTLPLLNTSKVTNFNHFLNMYNHENCFVLMPHIDTSKGTSFVSFLYSTNIVTSPNFDMSSAKSISYMYKRCPKLIAIPDLNINGGQIEQFSQMCMESYNIQSGLLNIYNKIKNSPAVGKSDQKDPFLNAGLDKDGHYASENIQEERAQIPVSFGGDLPD